MDLSEGQREALQNLAHKQSGQTVDWINIGDARALTALGCAERHSAGWRITRTGSAVLSGELPGSPPDSSCEAPADGTLPFRRPGG